MKPPREKPDHDADLKRLRYERELEDIKGGARQGWLTIAGHFQPDGVSCAYFCAVIPNALVEKALESTNWDLMIGNGGPGFVTFYDKNSERSTYYGVGGEDGIEPFVIRRKYFGLRPQETEIIEEFRLFHNLFFDPENSIYKQIDRDGNEESVVEVVDKTVRVRVKQLRQYLGAKRASLALFFSHHYYSWYSLEELGIEESHDIVKSESMVYSLTIRDAKSLFTQEGQKSFSQLIGKRIIPGAENVTDLPWFSSEDDDRFSEYVIGVDDNGTDIAHTCDPEVLANFFGKNKGAPGYLTPVFFRREVLAKYYANPDRYSVEDGYLRCGSLWDLRMDNNHKDYVVVFLGDLGSDLSFQEQLYWKSHNVRPEGTMSEVQIRRSFLAEFADPEQADLRFKSAIREFRRVWKLQYGWELFLPFAERDVHFEKALRIPLTEDHAEFDQQVLSLTKILIDSLNEAEIQKVLPAKKSELKGISKLEAFLEVRGVNDVAPRIKFLRNLQDLRSTAVVHRKGSKFEKIASDLGLDKKGLIKSFTTILIQASEFIDWLRKEVILKDVPGDDDLW